MGTFRPLAQNLFALLIGIDTYGSKAIRSLRGAVADAQAFATYLQHQLSVPQDQITVLKNESATRAAILGAIQCLANDTRIEHGDPIVIFYAGRGSEAPAPPGWEAGGPNANIQLTLPYDVFCKSGEEVVAPIPDRTLGALLQAVSQEKGNNIVVITDSCYFASGMKSFDNSADMVRSVLLPPNFRIQADLDQDIWSLSPRSACLLSHVLLSACSPSGPAFEANGRGIFTVALLDLLEDSQIDKLRYCDIIMRMDIDSMQNPYCEGLYRERCIFTTTSPPIQYFIPAYTRISKNGPIAYVLNGGAAHGLAVGDELVVYPDMDYPVSKEILVVEEVGSYYAIMCSLARIPIGGNSVAVRVKEAKRQPLLIYIHSTDKVLEMLSSLRVRAQDFDFSNFDLVPTSDECNINISIQDDQAIVRLKNPRNTQSFSVKPTVEELLRILKASWQYFSELGRTAYFPNITENVEVELYELQQALSQFPTAVLVPFKAVPHESDLFTLRQGITYCLKLTNNSPYDLYPIVQCFDSSKEFMIDTLYRSVCCRSELDAPLKKGGRWLTIGCGSSGSPLFFTASDRQGFVSLKITLPTRPLDPSYDVQTFRWARHIPENLSDPWATIIKAVIHHPYETQSPFPDTHVEVTIVKTSASAWDNNANLPWTRVIPYVLATCIGIDAYESGDFLRLRSAVRDALVLTDRYKVPENEVIPTNKQASSVTTPKGHINSVISVAFSFSSGGKRIVSGSYDKSVWVWDTSTGDELKERKGHTNWVTSVAYSPDGKVIVSGSNENSLIWDASTGVELKERKGHTNSVISAAFSPDGKHIASGSSYNKSVRVWDASTGDELKERKGHTNSVMPEGVIVVIDALDECYDGNAFRLFLETLLKLAVGLPIKFLLTSRPEPVIREKMFAPGYSHSVLHLHDIEESIVEADIKTYLSEALGSMSPTPSPNDVEQLAKHAGELFIYAVTAVRYIYHPRGNSSARLQAVLGKVSGSTKQHEELHKLYTNILSTAIDPGLEEQEIKNIRLTLETVLVAFSPDGKHIVLGSYENSVRIWDASTGIELKERKGHTNSVMSVAYSPGGEVKERKGQPDGKLEFKLTHWKAK